MFLPIMQKFIVAGVSRYGYGHVPQILLEQACKLELFEIISDRAMSAEDFAMAAGISERGATVLLNALTGLKLLKKKAGIYSANQSWTAFFLAQRPCPEDAYIRKTGLQTSYYKLASALMQKWFSLEESLRTGKPVATYNSESEGTSYFTQFAEGMFSNSFRAAWYFAHRHGAKKPQKVLDLGAGSGAWSMPFAINNAQTQVRAVDWVGVLPLCQRISAQCGVEKQYTLVGDDLLKADLGQDNTVAILGHIIHTEGEARSKALLKRCYAAMAPGGQVVIAEWVANDRRDGPTHVSNYAVTMLLSSDTGDAFTYAEMAAWLREAGFSKVHKVAIPSMSPLIVGIR